MITLIIIILVYLYMIKPNRKNDKRMKKVVPFAKKYVAHRGLYAVNKEGMENFPENSIPAFKRAVKYGYGIELDVRLTKDKKLIVFHDKTTKRMCGINRKVSSITYRQIRRYSLLDTEFKIPNFKETMEAVDGKSPLLIEIKHGYHIIATTKILLEELKGYRGDYVIESFNPLALIYLRIHAPEIIRGQLVEDRVNGHKMNLFMDIFMNIMLFNFLSKPDFIASNHKYAEKPKYKIMRKLYDYVAAAWTIKNEEELSKAKEKFDIIIFDNFAPNN